MKKFFSLIICLLLSGILNAQERIKMEKSGGIYKIPCEVNGLRMKFYFDTGGYVYVGKRVSFKVGHHRYRKIIYC